MVTSDFRPEVEIRPFRACAMHPAISSVIVDLAMGQIPRFTERISSIFLFCCSLYLLCMSRLHLKM